MLCLGTIQKFTSIKRKEPTSKNEPTYIQIGSADRTEKQNQHANSGLDIDQLSRHQSSTKSGKGRGQGKLPHAAHVDLHAVRVGQAATHAMNAHE